MKRKVKNVGEGRILSLNELLMEEKCHFFCLYMRVYITTHFHLVTIHTDTHTYTLTYIHTHTGVGACIDSVSSKCGVAE